VNARHVFALIVAVTACARTGESAPEERRIQLIVAAEPREAEELRQVAAELLGRLSVTLRTDRVERIDVEDLARPIPPHSEYLARVFIDLRQRNRAVVWFVDPAHDRILMRQVERVPAGEELLREELGHILETSTEGLLSGAEIGLPRASVLLPTKARDMAPPQNKTPLLLPKPLVQFAFLYEVQGLSNEVLLTHGPEASGYLALPPRHGAFGIWLTGQYRFPVHVETGPVGARIEGGALRAMLTFDWLRREVITIRGALGGGADILRLDPESLGGRVELADGRVLALAMVRAGLGLEIRIAPIVSLWSRVAVDVDATGTRYVFEGREGERLVLNPWTLRPALALGAGFP
jgi:hypothetical protein